MSLSPPYQAALDIIYNYVDYERGAAWPTLKQHGILTGRAGVLAALDNPHRSYHIVHVAGSKGKGSTAAGIESILRAGGLRTGFFTSPHLHTFRERIRVGGELIGRDEVVALLEQCMPAIEAVPGITTFEIMTVLALMHFAARQVQWAVLEVGLGGRLDSTNVVTPDVASSPASVWSTRRCWAIRWTQSRARRPESSSQVCRSSSRRRLLKRWQLSPRLPSSAARR